MKVEVFESAIGLEFTLTPESVDDFAMLLRYSRNAAAKKPEVFLSFHGNPYCSISLNKRRYPYENNSVNPDLK